MDYPLVFEDVSFSYVPNKDLLSHVSLSFPFKGLYVFLGKSGCGKTTFLHLLTGRLKPTEGKIRSSFEEPFSMVYQSPLLLDYLTVYENVKLSLSLNGLEDKDMLIDKVLEQVSLLEYKDKLVKYLSGGEKMRVSIARVLVLNRPVLVFDEPTGQLDEKNSLVIYELIKTLSEDHLVFLVTHDQKKAALLFDNVYIFKDKQIVPIKKEEKKTIKFCQNALPKEKGKGCLCYKEALSISYKYLRFHPFRVLLSSFFLALAMTIFSLGMNINRQSERFLSDLLQGYYSYPLIAISHKSVIAKEGNLTLERYETIDETIQRDLKIDKTYPCLEYFFPSYQEVYLNGIYKDVRFLPVLNENKENLKIGGGLIEPFSLVVNDNFLDAFQLDSNIVLGKKLSLSSTSYVYASSFESQDLCSLASVFEIKGISKEQKAFNEPIVYFRYEDILDLLREVLLTNISAEKEETLTPYDLLFNTSYQKEDFTSHKSYLLSEDIFAFEERCKKLYGEDIKLTSKALEVKESTLEILYALDQIFIVFLLLVLLSAFMLTFLTVYSLYDENIRLFTLAYVFSSQKKNKRRLAFATGFLFCLASLLLVLVLETISKGVINIILTMQYYPSLFSFFDLPTFLLVLILCFFFTLIASLLPLQKIKEQRIKKELEGED